MTKLSLKSSAFPMSVAIVLILVSVIAVIAFLLLRKPARPSPDKAPPTQTTPEPRSPKKSREPKPRRPPAPVIRPLESAELVFNVGSTTPITITVDPRGEFLFVPCHNRQQLLFSIAKFENPTQNRVVQRYKLAEDTIADCTFVRNKDECEIVAALERDHAIRSYVIDTASARSRPGLFQADEVCKYQIVQVRMPPDNAYIVVLADETYIRVYRPNGVHIFGKDTSQMHNQEIAVSSNSELLAASSYTSDIVVYGMERDRSDVPVKVVKACTLGQHTNSIETIDFDRKTMVVATGGKDSKFNVFQAPLRWREGEDARLKWSGTTTSPILKIRVAPGGNMIAILLADGSLVLRKQEGIVKTVACAHSVPITGESVRLEWHPNGKWVFIAMINSPFIYGYSAP
jgi:hypothetical protein